MRTEAQGCAATRFHFSFRSGIFFEVAKNLPRDADLDRSAHSELERFTDLALHRTRFFFLTALAFLQRPAFTAAFDSPGACSEC
jgi:hypothetical protein